MVCQDTEITLSSMSDRHKIRSWGLFGGGEGTTGGLSIKRAGSDTWQRFTEACGKVSPSKFSNAAIHPGDKVRVVAPGAGGYGRVAERDPALIAEDLREGWITPEVARRDYGYPAEVE